MYKIRLDCVDSTNTYAKTHYKEFPQGEISCIVANEQTAGKGTFLKPWISPKDVNLYITFHYQITQKNPNLEKIALLTSECIVSLLKKLNVDAKIKWPNDIFLNGKKLGGVLCEVEFHDQRAELFIGIGLNINLDKKTAETIDQPATSLFIETNKIWDKDKLLTLIQNEMELKIKSW